MGDPLGRELLELTRHAFVDSFQVIAVITAALSIGLSLLVIAVLRRRRPALRADHSAPA
jgi:hypothetical protein